MTIKAKKKSQRQTPKPMLRGRTGPRSRYKPTYPLEAYRLLRAGLTVDDLLRQWKISRTTLYNYWREQYPELKEAMETAEKEREQERTFPEYVYHRLSPELRGLWDKIKKYDKVKDGQAKIETLLLDSGRRVRQQLFLHALCMHGFNPSVALSKVNVSKRELDRWIMEDQGFSELVREIDWHKGNFFEGALVQLVSEGNASAVLHANKTYNSDRGYGSRSEVSFNGKMEVEGKILHGVLDLTELMPFMGEEVQLGVLAAIRAREQDLKKKEGLQNRVLDVEEVMTEQIQEVALGSVDTVGSAG